MPETTDSLNCPTDSLSVDSLELQIEPHWGITLEAPPGYEAAETSPGSLHDETSSWIVILLIIPFLIISIKLKHTSRFLASLFQDLTSIRERHSIFDTTVRESSMLFTLILLTTIAGGVLLGAATIPDEAPYVKALPPILNWLEGSGFGNLISGMPYQLLHTLVCILLMAIYMTAIWIAYNVAGRVFETPGATHVWVQGFAASMGLLGLVLLPLALLVMGMPEWTPILVIIAVVGFILAKITFIWKGFRIFCFKGASWVLFLYYLCSLEVVPVVFVIAAASFRG